VNAVFGPHFALFSAFNSFKQKKQFCEKKQEFYGGKTEQNTENKNRRPRKVTSLNTPTISVSFAV
jgi:hypothetical protein